MTNSKNIILLGKHQKPILTDVFYKEETRFSKSFSHEIPSAPIFKTFVTMTKYYNGFSGFVVLIKFNFSYNGGTLEQPIDFPDLEAFGNNNYTKELDDLETVIDWICSNSTFKNDIDLNNINLIGHSRAGGIVTIKAEEDHRVKKVIMWHLLFCTPV